ncbi:hypothetical protein MMC09_004160 [Bachmanniomyces sp. S44760]|nr:hypothetical protein [Bachmanniomyces sp. S44760]
MAYDLQARFRKLRLATFDPNTPVSPNHTVKKEPKHSDNADDREKHCIRHGSTLHTDNVLEFPFTSSAADSRVLEVSASGDIGAEVATPPIEIPIHNGDHSEAVSVLQDPLQESTYREVSPLEEFMRNRRPSISFNPQVTLESGHRRPLEEPLPRIETRLRGRSILQELNDRPVRSPLGRARSETDTRWHDPVTGQFVKDHNHRPYRLGRTHLDFPKVDVPPHDEVEQDPKPVDPVQNASLTSESTASPVIEEVRTPPDPPMDMLLSPISPHYSPFNHPTSLDSTSAWPSKPRRRESSRAKSYTIERQISLRSSAGASLVGRRGSSRRSTSSSLSPATAFLSKWGRDDAPLEPDDEGQEVGEYVLGKQIGFGGFSIVREAFTLSKEGERLRHAVKIVRKQVRGKEDLENEALQAEFEHEVDLWRCLSHRNILPLIAVYVTDFATFCFTQLNTGGTLFDLVRANRKGVRRDIAKRYAFQLAGAIRYLHEDVRVVHRDLKLENCLLDLSNPNAAEQGGDLLLCDFGLAEFITSENGLNGLVGGGRGPAGVLGAGSMGPGQTGPDSYENAADRPPPRNIGPSETSTSIAGSLQYASPELILCPAGLLLPAVDIWAFGVITFALMCGDLPFQHTFQPRVQMMILAGEWDRNVLRGACSEDLYPSNANETGGINGASKSEVNEGSLQENGDIYANDGSHGNGNTHANGTARLNGGIHQHNGAKASSKSEAAQIEELISGCLTMDTDERWDVGMVLESQWLKGCQEAVEEVKVGWRL